jgi:intracellular multiplication protein IcmB
MAIDEQQKKEAKVDKTIKEKADEAHAVRSPVNSFVEGLVTGVDTFLAWWSSGVGQTMQSYCDIQTADSETDLVANDGSLLSVIQLDGAKALVGREEFKFIVDGLLQTFRSTLSQPGFSIQFHFDYSRDRVVEQINNIYKPSVQTAKTLNLHLDDLFRERKDFLSKFCANERVHLVLWTKQSSMNSEQLKRAHEDKANRQKEGNFPPFQYTQNVPAAFADLRDSHDSFVRSVLSDLQSLGLVAELLTARDAIYYARMTVDPNFTDEKWRPVLPGDKIKVKVAKSFRGDVSDILWPSLSKQLMPRDAYNIDNKVCKIGDMIYSSVFIDLFPREIQPFMVLFGRALDAQIPWRISFLIDGGGLNSLRLKRAMSSLLSFSSADNRLINDACGLLDYIELNGEDAVVRLRVVATTWAKEGDFRTLRANSAQLARAMQGWGSCDVSEMCGDAFAGTVASMLAVTGESPATTTVASLKDTLAMLPVFRPSSPWRSGAMLFRSPDGKPWPYQPGSPHQTTWIDLIFARPGSGKSVLSNALNLALILSGGNIRMPRVAVIDIGPSSSGLISLLQEALPLEKKHYVAYHRLRMTPEYSINPFDTQLGCRFPTPQERGFLVNFISLISTPVGMENPYDGVADLAGMVVDEAYKAMSNDGVPSVYAHGVEREIDAILEEIGFVGDSKTTWWEVTDALFVAGFIHQAMLAQRNAVPLLSDIASIARTSVIEDLYGKVTVPTGESLIDAVVRMVSSAVREYPVLSRVTQFDIGDARVVSLDLDEVAKGGGAAADRQTSVMYMLARYVLAKDYYLNMESLGDISSNYRDFHEKRIGEIREDHKRIVLDEFHRTSRAGSVRNQVLQDMREGRKWNVQIGLISQSLDDFDDVMVEFGTSVFIMDAGPEQAIARTKKTFGLSDTATHALRSRVHGPKFGGATFLAQFSTKQGMNTQLLTLTLGPIELWAFSTTSSDASLRNQLYAKIGPREARRILATIFPSGTCSKYLEDKLAEVREDSGVIDESVNLSMVDALLHKIILEYKKNPNFKRLPG